MKALFLQIFFLVLWLSTQAQKVSNIRAEQHGQEIVVLYSLETTSSCEVGLLLSQDNGVTWGSTLKNVSGDVGKNIEAGEKQITWKVLEEHEQLVGDNLKFKVIANGKKSFEPEMIFVEGGKFQMGSETGESDEKPVHSVTLSSYNIGMYEVTQAQWKSVMGSNPSNFTGCDNCPVESVSWNDVQQYIQKLNTQTGKNYRLPTEAEWEYAAKGGKASRGWTYSGSNDLGTVAWFSENSGNRTHAAGTKQANELGIYDMTGNVWEWCSDWYGNYSSRNVTNPTGASSGEARILRDGSWRNAAAFCVASYRLYSNPDYEYREGGFRLVLPNEVLVEPEMVFVEGGTFQMGSDTISGAEKPIHTVTLSSFNIGRYEVTQAQWKAVMGNNPSWNIGCDNCPVENVSRNDVQQYIQKLNAQTGKNYRLPREAEWEYSAKGGKASRGYTYCGSNDLGTVAWYRDNSGSKTHATGAKQANELGLYDMSGNVDEFCSDWYGNYNIYSVNNPTGASNGEYRVLRGGSWNSNTSRGGTSHRHWDRPVVRDGAIGFRLVLPVE